MVSETPARYLPRTELERFIGAIRAGDRAVIGPTVGDGAIVLKEIKSVAELPAGTGVVDAPGRSRLVRRTDSRLFDYPVGPTSWKAWTFPPRTTQAAWALDDRGQLHLRPVTDEAVEPTAFLGVRACEIAALRIQDRVLLGGPAKDPDYAARRGDNLIVAVECAVAGATCFCTSMGTGPELTEGFDLALSELDDGFVVRVGTDAGAAVIETLELAPATGEELASAAASVARVRRTMGKPLPIAGMPERLMAAPDHPRWAEVADRCLACANCTLVCPTCFCTSVGQRSELDGQAATTERRLDSCFTLEFAKVAGGNFRTRREDRYRQWLTHKFGTWWEQFGSSGCVGCGRCIAWCPVGIDVRQELMAIAPPPLPAEPTTMAVPPTVLSAQQVGQTELPWVVARVAAVKRESSDVVTLRLETGDPALLAGQPGQFVMAALPALAAPPISISRFHRDGLELTVRASGAASAAITRLERGASLSLRGPLGRGWPVEQAIGRDVQIVTGGIGLAPLRPLLDALLANRERIGVIHLAYGARTPRDRLFREELDALAASAEIEVAQTVDRAGPEWLGRVGVVTQVIDRVMCACDRTVAFVCGPERMMAATAEVLRERGVPDERIFVTLERHMDCGVGLCGHCQLGKFFVCRDGPVFSLAELGSALGQEGL
jgi:NAD(P)H-flavin reductase/Fe-S-cluster-containing hydrogenase component 2